MPGLFGSPVVAPSGDGRLELFIPSIDGSLWHIWQTTWSNGWSGWASHGGEITEWPAAIARNGDGRLITLAVGGGGLEQIEQTAWSNGWSGWLQLGLPPTGAINAPSVAAGADGRLILFASGTGQGGPPQLWRLEQQVWGGAWQPTWFSHAAPVGQFITGPPVVILDAQGCAQVFVVSDTGEMWNVRQTAPAGAWTGWNTLGTGGVGFSDRPAVAASGDGRLELFVRGNDNALWHAWQTAVGNGWSEWVSFGDAGVGFQDHPAMAPSADGRLELFITGLDGNLWHTWQTEASNGWLFWSSQGNGGVRLLNGPTLAASGDRRLELFVLGADGALHHIWQTAASNGWSSWSSLGHP
ncbi:MAG TPA: hypothetical protein VGF34_18015 [Stellaceae bacterium]|jgi:hypothetical protein